MSRSAKRWAGLMVLAACFASPILEVFDRWDWPYSNADNTETALFVLALAVGVTLLVPRHLWQGLLPAGRSSLAAPRILAHAVRPIVQPAPASGTSPPPILRV